MTEVKAVRVDGRWMLDGVDTTQLHPQPLILRNHQEVIVTDVAATNIVNNGQGELGQDPETKAILVLTQCLNQLDPQARERVMAYVIRRYWNADNAKRDAQVRG